MDTKKRLLCATLATVMSGCSTTPKDYSGTVIADNKYMYTGALNAQKEAAAKAAAETPRFPPIAVPDFVKKRFHKAGDKQKGEQNCPDFCISDSEQMEMDWARTLQGIQNAMSSIPDYGCHIVEEDSYRNNDFKGQWLVSNKGADGENHGFSVLEKQHSEGESATFTNTGYVSFSEDWLRVRMNISLIPLMQIIKSLEDGRCE